MLSKTACPDKSGKSRLVGKNLFLLFIVFLLLQLNALAQEVRSENISDQKHFNPTIVTDLDASYRDGQVFVTWENLDTTEVRYNLYKSPDPVHYGFQLASAQNLGSVRDNSARNLRLTTYTDTSYFKIDSAGTPLANTQGLFVATCTEQGSFYYAVTTTIGGVEDTTIHFGINSLSTPISESIEIPQPVWQETRTVTNRILEIYAQFVSKVTSLIYPQMTNEGSFAFHFAINKQGNISPHPITFFMRPSHLSFLTDIKGIGDPNEWIVTIDDWFPSGREIAGLYYGYHEDYDIFSYSNPQPTSGTIYDYSAARVAFTINWCLQNLPVDSTKTYMTGWSLGGIGVILNSIMIAEKIAAIHIYAPIFDLASPNPVTGYLYQLYGSTFTNLLTNEGYTRNQRLNACYLVSEKRNSSLPLMFTFCGKDDSNVGWEEKIAFYDSLNLCNHGGFHFWSQTNHFSTYTQWRPNFPDFSFLTRYRTDLSYPAFSNCSFNDNPGNGASTDGDSTGTINGYIDWLDNIVDSSANWEITLFIKDLLTTQGTLIAPDTGVTDVTLRRLQSFSIPTNETVYWENANNGTIIQQGTFTYTGDLITIPEVKIFKDSSRLKVFYTPVSVDEQMLLPKQFALEQNYPNPFNPVTKIKYSIPQSSNVVIKVFDILGNEIEFLVNEEKPTGTYEITWYADKLPSGIYFYQLKAGEYVNTKKMLLLK